MRFSRLSNKGLRFVDPSGSTTARTVVAQVGVAHPASRTQVDPRREYLERSVGVAKIALMQEVGVLDDVLEVLPIPSAMIMTSEEDPAVIGLEDFVETDILLTLDRGCCDHIVDMADAPGYAAVLHPSPGSQRNQQFVVGNGDRVANRRQIKLRMKANGENGLLMSSVAQVAEITRSLMSVS